MSFYSKGKHITRKIKLYRQSTEVAYLLLTQKPLVWFSAFPRTFHLMLLRFIDGTAKNSAQRLDNVNWTHLALASSKLVLQKSLQGSWRDIVKAWIFLAAAAAVVSKGSDSVLFPKHISLERGVDDLTRESEIFFPSPRFYCRRTIFDNQPQNPFRLVLGNPSVPSLPFLQKKTLFLKKTLFFLCICLFLCHVPVWHQFPFD